MKRNQILTAMTSLLISVALIGPVQGQEAAKQPEALENVGLDQKLGSQVPLNLNFLDESGAPVTLGDYFGEKPVILTLVYYECPMLCTYILNGTLRAMRAMEFSAGNEFDVVTVSINPDETPELAMSKKVEYLENYQRESGQKGWHFLTGTEDQIKTLADAVGFRYTYDPASGEYVHASGIMVLTPDGQVARYFYGVEYSPRDLRLGLVEASNNEIGSPTDQVLLFCYQYNPLTGKYSFAILSILRVAGALTLIGIALLITLLIRRERKGPAQVQASA
ncbi:MAG: SCO family protein [Acidobacteriota bacterium]|nr:MAG: SCO family protein [Acidobacteriota bacterium]